MGKKTTQRRNENAKGTVDKVKENTKLLTEHQSENPDIYRNYKDGSVKNTVDTVFYHTAICF